MIKSAPLSFILFLLCGGVSGYFGSNWYYGKQITDRDSQISRYRVALGVDKGSSNALVELNNQELKAAALNSVSKVRGMCVYYRAREAQIKPAQKGDEKQENERSEALHALRKEVSEEFDRDLKADFLGANNELLRRLDRKAVASVVRGPIFSDAETGIPVGMPSLISGDDEAPFLCLYADQLEQFAKLLPGT